MIPADSRPSLGNAKDLLPAHQLFEAQASRTPDAIAVAFKDIQLTYSELNRRANQLAHHMRSRGVGPEILVGLYANRSLEFIVGLLGVLKAGAAYLPLEPSHPQERLAWMIEDAQVGLLLVQAQLAEHVPALDIPHLRLDSTWSAIADQPDTNLTIGAAGDQLAYIIYTSGSTGRPKGVMIAQDALAQHSLSVGAHFTLTPADRVLQFAAIGFDVAVEEIVPALLYGATVVLWPRQDATPIPEFLQLIDELAITVINIPSPYWHAWVAEQSSALHVPDSLRLVIVGSDKTSAQHLATWRQTVGERVRWMNGYGPTEATISTTFYEPTVDNVGAHGSVVAIGLPFDQSEVYVLDRQLQPVPSGASGDLYIGGGRLARGYLNRPDLTAERFIPHPFSCGVPSGTGTQPGARLYHTGDIARVRADGNLEFVGRGDRQVKIRGFRIELGEIEAGIERHPQVRETIVLARDDVPGGQQLVAYVVPEPAADTESMPAHDRQSGVLDAAQLAAFLRETLPPYMLPSAWMFLERFPQTSSGKIDRRVLPKPDRNSFVSNELFVAASTPVEVRLIEVWSTLFGLNQISIHDNFFTLGGHSLAALQMLARIRETFGVELPLAALFTAPTVAQLARVVERERSEVQDMRLPPVQLAARDQPLPPSFSQERIWFISQVVPDSIAYHAYATVHFTGRLNIPVLERTLTEIVRRHEIMRTTFNMDVGRCIQLIQSPFVVTLPVVDISMLPPDQRQARAKLWIYEECQQPFDLMRLPLVRWTLLKLDADEYILVQVEHHFLHDGWALARLLHEIKVIYAAYLVGQPSPLPEPTIQYADFAVWQRQWLQSDLARQQLAYWERKLAGAPPLLALPTDRPRPAMQSFRGRMHRPKLPGHIGAGLRALSRAESSTLFMTMLTGFVAMLYRYTHQRDIVIGSAVANRRLRETEQLLGMIVNNIVIRAAASGEMTFRQLLAHMREVTLEAYAHQDLPFDKVVEILRPERNLSYNPIFQVMFSFHDSPIPDMELPELVGTVDYPHNGSAKFDLNVVVMPQAEQRLGQQARLDDQQMVLEWEYNSDLFDDATIVNLIGHYQTFLESIIADPDLPIAALQLLTPQEQDHILKDWNNTAITYPGERYVHQIFERQAKQTPDATAVVFGDQSLSYAELNRRSNQLAHHLRRLGVGADDLVGVCMERSPELVVALYGVLKAGGAYVPLDPSYPLERLRFMVQDSQPVVVVSQAHLLTSLSDLLDSSDTRRVISLDQDWSALAGESVENPASDLSDDRLAYMIYTSGSTGWPKGAMNTHRGLLNRLQWMQEAFALTEADRIMQKTPFSFDVSVWEFFWPLMTGATLVVAQPEGHKDSAYLVRLINEQQVTVLHFVPSMLQAFLEEPAVASCVSLRQVICSGEALPFDLQQRFFSKLNAELANLYGPTEAAIDVTFWLCRRDSASGIVPIGYPIANTQMYVLDSALQPVPVGVHGELYIGGVQLARGYLNRPDLTAEKFIPDPFSGTPGARLYRTGDLARQLPDGNIAYLGRIDHQVKLRGFRIELGEIEAVLRQHPCVQDAVVLLREDRAAKRLVAYVTAIPEAQSEDADSGIVDLRAFMLEQLPEYMIPALFVQLPSLPLLPNGKIDRRALPAPGDDRPALNDTWVAPRSAEEQLLVEIWQQVLGLKQVGVYDNFFELGGDSILSLQIIARANQAGLRLVPKQMFQHQTIAGLATVVGTTSVPLAEQHLLRGELPLLPIQHWFFEQELSQPHHWNQALLLEAPATLNPTLLAQAFDRLTVHHDALRLRFGHGQAGWHQWHSEPAPTSIATVDLSAVAAEAQAVAIVEAATELQASLNLSDGPLLRLGWFNLGSDQPSRLLIVIHHLLVDGVSWGIIREDLSSVYQQLSRGEQPHLPRKTMSLKRWAEQLTDYAATGATQELAYWICQPWERVQPLPLDAPAHPAANTVASATSLRVALDADETRALLQDVPAAYRTQINDVLLTALSQAYSRWAGSQPLLIDLEGHGRESLNDHVDVSRTVGWFTSVFPVLLDLTAETEPDTALKVVKEQLRAIPQHGLGYGVLRYLSSDPEIQAQLRALPQAEILFNYRGQSATRAEDGLFSSASESPGETRSPQGRQRYLLEINVRVHQGRVELEWIYSRELHRAETIERLAADMLDRLRGLIAHCVSEAAGGYTPSDFPLAGLDQPTLDRIVAGQHIEDIYTLSPAQQGMMFHSLYTPDSDVYFEQIICTLRGDLDVPTMQQAWQQLVERYTVLRTTFVWDGLAQPLQIVHRTVELPWRYHDWRSLPEAEQQAQLDVLLQTDRQQTFDLAQPPLLRLTLVRRANDWYDLIWSYHHLLMDGWSWPLLLRDLFTAYDAFRRSEVPIQQHARRYREYIAWLQRQDLAAAEQFWRTTLAGFTTSTVLPVVQALSEQPSPALPVREWFHLSSEVSAALESLAKRSGLTLSTLFQGVWSLVLYHYTGDQDVLFGATVAGRPVTLPGVESMVGLFINTLPVRVSIQPEATVLAWLHALQLQQVEAREYEYTPLVEIQGWSDVPRGQQLFDTLLVFENYPWDASIERWSQQLTVADLRVVERNNYPLTFVVLPGKEIALSLNYDQRFYQHDTIVRMAGHIQALLEDLVFNPQRRVADTAIVTAEEHAELVVRRNQTQAEYPREKCIHHFFEAQVLKTPDAIAALAYPLVGAGSDQRRQLTYHELNVRANQVAHALRAQGIQREQHVAICMERSLDLLIGVLGIMKAGAAFVPLDPSFPRERMAYILDDAQVAGVLTQQDLLAAIPVGDVLVLCLDRDWPTIATMPEGNLDSGVAGDNLAYLIYTSGSTGKPKGVLIPHFGIVNYLYWCVDAYGAASGRGAPVHASIAADAIFPSLFAPLFVGTSVLIFPESQALETLADVLIHEGRFSFAKITPSQLEVLNHQLPSTSAEGWVDTLVVGAEAVRAEVLEYWQEHAPGSLLLNEYGPTETVVGCSIYPVPRDTAFSSALPIGLPIANLTFYVLNERMQPVPVGVTGELYIGGDGVARGYYGRAELTAEKFVPDPFCQQPGARMYRSGDVVRWLDDRAANIDFLGRADDQVKIRGYRVELGEIEAVLDQHPGVWEVVVLAREDVPGNRRLVAYVVPNPVAVPNMLDLRQYLIERLPEYMVPAVFVPLETMPLAPHGKIDRKALPIPDMSRPETGQAFIGPRTPIEAILAEIWSTVLGVEQIGVHDNFFLLGGHSLLATQTIARARQSFQVDLPLHSLFDAPTIAGLAETIVAYQLEDVADDDLAALLADIEQLSAEDALSVLKTQPLEEQE